MLLHPLSVLPHHVRGRLFERHTLRFYSRKRTLSSTSTSATRSSAGHMHSGVTPARRHSVWKPSTHDRVRVPDGRSSINGRSRTSVAFTLLDHDDMSLRRGIQTPLTPGQYASS